MTRVAMPALLGPEFDSFLFAPVDVDGGGAVLSVLSALARLDVDPWREAAALALLSREAAHQRLASLIAALPDAPARLAPATIADRLIQLLPRENCSSVASRDRSLVADPGPSARTVANLILINLVLMAGMLCAQWASTSLRPPSIDSGHAEVSGTVIPQTPRAGHVH